MARPSGQKRRPHPEEQAEAKWLAECLREHLALCAPGRSRLDRDGVLRAPQAFVAEKAGVRPGDLSAVICGRAPAGLAVTTILKKLRECPGWPEAGPMRSEYDPDF